MYSMTCSNGYLVPVSSMHGVVLFSLKQGLPKTQLLEKLSCVMNTINCVRNLVYEPALSQLQDSFGRSLTTLQRSDMKTSSVSIFTETKNSKATQADQCCHGQTGKQLAICKRLATLENLTYTCSQYHAEHSTSFARCTHACISCATLLNIAS